MAGGNQKDSGMITGINVTPMVDVVLVLLIIFIVTAKIIEQPAVPLELPKASSGQDVQVVFSVIVPTAGPILVDGVPLLTDEALLPMARAAVERDKDLRAVLQIDGGVPHRRTIALLDQLRRGGVVHIAFGVESSK